MMKLQEKRGACPRGVSESAQEKVSTSSERKGRADAPDHADGERDDEEVAALTLAVRDDRQDEREDGGDDVGRRGDEERVGLAVVEVAHDGRDELRERARRRLGCGVSRGRSAAAHELRRASEASRAAAGCGKCGEEARARGDTELDAPAVMKQRAQSCAHRCRLSRSTHCGERERERRRTRQSTTMDLRLASWPTCSSPSFEPASTSRRYTARAL